MKRRKFIQYSSATAGLLSFGKLQVAAGSMRPAVLTDDKILIVIQLFGGNDALNTIIPLEIDSYFTKYRPIIGIAKQDAIKIPNTTLGMHPSLKSGVNNGLSGLYTDGKLAIIQGVGYDNPNFSHFRSTDFWLSGLIPASDAEVLDSGWIGRYFDDYYGGTTAQSPYSINVGNTPSLVLQSKTGSNALLVEDPNLFYHEGKYLDPTQTPISGTSNYINEYAYIQGVTAEANQYSQVLKAAFDAGSNQEQYADKGLCNKLKLVARLISGGLKTKVYFVGLNGFDTHASQGSTSGIHASLLSELSDAVSAFMSDLSKQKLADNVVGITISEFGRRAIENASFGTDHGAASVMFAFGNGVRGQMFGKSLLEAPMTTDNNFIYQYDYRRIYAELLQTWLGASPVGAKSILANNFSVIEKGVLKSTIIDTPKQLTPILKDVYSQNSDGSLASFSPNPVTNDGNLSVAIPLNNSQVRVQQFDVSGRNLGQLFNGNIAISGVYDIPMSINGNQGIYLLEVNVNGKIQHVKVLKM